MNKEGESGFKGIVIVFLISILIAAFWNQLEFIRNIVSTILDPTAGALLSWDVTWGMILIIFIISVFITLFQKYATDQETLKELKKEQKEMNKKSQEFKHNPEKMMEVQKELMPLMMRTMKISMRPIIYTGIPLILFFRWFMDYFAAIGDPRFFGIFSWFWFYLLGSLIFSSVLRKILKVA